MLSAAYHGLDNVKSDALLSRVFCTLSGDLSLLYDIFIYIQLQLQTC